MLLQDNGYNMTLISPTDLYYNGVAPGVLSNRYPKGFGRINARCHLNKVKGKFYRKIVKEIDIKNKKVHFNEDESIRFDYLSINIGGRVPTNNIPGSSTYSFAIRPIDRFWQFTDELEHLMNKFPDSITIVIIGGGAAGVEVAGNVYQLIKSRGITPIISIITKGDTLLSQFPSRASNKVLKLFRKRGINILLKSKVIEIKRNKILLMDDKEYPYDLCVLATGVSPNTIDSQGLLHTTERGELVVNSFLQCKDRFHIFATGDCSFFEPQPLWKSGYHAINQGPVLLKNLLAISKGSRLRAYKPSKRILTALNLGNGTGLLILGKYSHMSKFSFVIKDVIERRYINSYICRP